MPIKNSKQLSIGFVFGIPALERRFLIGLVDQALLGMLVRGLVPAEGCGFQSACELGAIKMISNNPEIPANFIGLMGKLRGCRRIGRGEIIAGLEKIFGNL